MNNLTIFLAKYLIFIIGLLVIVIWLTLKKDKKIEFALAVIMAAVVALISAKIISKLYYHPRPFVTANVKPLFPHANDSGFPSEHTTGAAALATVVYFYKKQFAAGLFILAIIVGIARVAAHVHSPLDIIGGLVLGLVSGWLGYWLAKKILPKNNQPPVL